jgi:glutamate dehydrogenase
VTTAIVNEIVNAGGISFVFRAVEESGATAADVIRAYVIVRDVFELPRLWAAVREQDNQIPTTAQTIIYLQARRLMDRAVRWIVQSRRVLDVPAEIERLRPGVSALLPKLSTLFLGVERDALTHHSQQLMDLDVPTDLAEWGTRLLHSFGLLDVVEVAHQTGQDLDQVAGVYFVLSERFRVDDLLTKISLLPREDRWQTLARMALRYDLYAALAALTAEVLTSTAAADLSGDAEELVDHWEQLNEASITRARNAIGEFDTSGADLAALSVLLRQIRTLVMR